LLWLAGNVPALRAKEVEKAALNTGVAARCRRTVLASILDELRLRGAAGDRGGETLVTVWHPRAIE
jgi:hypothetical protein